MTTATKNNTNNILEDILPKKSSVAILLGNGPTLPRYTETIQSLYGKEAMSFGVNRIFQTSIIPVDYYVANDRPCWKHNYQDIWDLNCLSYFTLSKYENLQMGKLRTYLLNKNPFHFATTWGETFGHGYTSIYTCMQLAAIARTKTIHIFGVDCRPLILPGGEQKTHFYEGNRNRTEKTWKLIRKGIATGLENLDKLGIETTLHSELYHAES